MCIFRVVSSRKLKPHVIVTYGKYLRLKFLWELKVSSWNYRNQKSFLLNVKIESWTFHSKNIPPNIFHRIFFLLARVWKENPHSNTPTSLKNFTSLTVMGTLFGGYAGHRFGVYIQRHVVRTISSARDSFHIDRSISDPSPGPTPLVRFSVRYLYNLTVSNPSGANRYLRLHPLSWLYLRSCTIEYFLDDCV